MDNENIALDKQSTRQKILNTAIREFAEFGKAGARIDRIAEQAGVNKAMIYYYFNSKDNLYDASITDHFGNLVGGFKEKVTGSKTLEEIIGKVVEEYILIFRSNPFFKQILLRELAEENSPVINNISEVIIQSGLPEMLNDKLKSEMDKGVVKQIDIKQTIASLIAINIGFFIISPIISNVLNLSDFDKFISTRKEAVVDLFLNGVLTK